jgi:ribosomal RNA-processing protein 9
MFIFSDSIDCACLVNEETFFSGSNDGTLGIWSIAKKKPIFSIKNAHKNHITNGYNSCGWITSVAAYHNSDLLASGSDDGSIRIWSYTNLKNTLVERFQIKIVNFC